MGLDGKVGRGGGTGSSRDSKGTVIRIYCTMKPISNERKRNMCSKSVALCQYQVFT